MKIGIVIMIFCTRVREPKYRIIGRKIHAATIANSKERMVE